MTGNVISKGANIDLLAEACLIGLGFEHRKSADGIASISGRDAQAIFCRRRPSAEKIGHRTPLSAREGQRTGA